MARIPLTRGRFALVDDEDLAQLSRHRWTWVPNDRFGYAARWERRDGCKRTIYMHREVVGFGPGDPQVDHRDGNGLNNRRGNLRAATQSQNMANQRARRAGLRGAYPHRGRWKAQGKKNGRSFHLGVFDTEREAAQAWDAWAAEAWGEFARKN